MGCEVAGQKLNNEGTKSEHDLFSPILIAWLLCCLFPAFKSGAKATAVQALRVNRT
jgi:hypothetical protein